MATTIVTKSGSGAPTASDLVAGELAVDLTNGRLYTEDSGGTVLELGLNPNGNVNVTGSVTTDGLTVANTSVIAGDFDGGTAATYIRLQDDTDNFLFGSSNSLGSFVIKNETADAFRMSVANTGDVSFYEDTGTTPKFVWDASAESLGIGTSSMSSYHSTARQLVVGNGSDSNGITIASGSGGTSRLFFANGTIGGQKYDSFIAADHTDSSLYFGTGATGTEAMRIDASGNVTIKSGLVNGGGVLNLENTDSAVNGHDWGSVNFISNDSSTSASGIRASIVGTSTSFNGDGNLVFSTAPSNGVNAERMRIDDSGNVGIGTSANESGYKLDVRGWGQFEHPSGDCVVAIRAGNNTGSSFLYFGDQDSANPAYVGYNHTSNSMSFKAGGSLAMTIDSSGNLLVGKTTSNLGVAGVELRAGTSYFTNSAASPMAINRESTDGQLVGFYNDEVPAGDISVSGTTVSYNAFMGSHYSETVDTGILFGTVMEVTGELVDQNYAIQERLSKVKVSDTAESKNVYGVWIGGYDGGGETVAALGASWCRIASGVTLELGDLLVSNGDGTAKVQADDIIRSMTIGKVTSVTVKETHTDGSFVVPVVLYCG